jgi:putative alpha-1,2-mannosidase
LQNAPNNVYIQSATLNNKSFNQPWLFHSTLVKGGKLTLVMGDKPNLKWGSKLELAPPSMHDDK